jgi:hypothetical protein
MDVFILDVLLRPIDVVDNFVSILWTERYAEKGDFELVTLSTPDNKRRFVFDTMLSIPDSKRVMRVTTIEETIDYEEGAVLKITGVEITQIFEERTACEISIFDGLINSVWWMVGLSPKELMEYFVYNICYAGGLSDDDIIPFLQPSGSLYAPGTIPEPEPGGIEWSQKPATLYSALTDIAKAYDLGLRLYKDPDASKLYFEAYTGSDRTSVQTTLPPVIFSEDMSNLQNTTEFSTNVGHFNVVRVIYFHKDEFDNNITSSEVVEDPQVALSSGGFERKVKILTITSVPEELLEVDVPAYLQRLGREELTKSRTLSVYDGEIDQQGDYVYERDYFLGDMVEVRGNNGGAAFMRVVEQIIKEDKAGKSSYPSLITKTSINPGTWASWKYDVDWALIGSTEFWSNQ